ncbi:hypothetical protein GKC29_26355 [Micromonospora sp. WMMC415]|nr:hypothetical protein GKC29_26355 [Micromonospora sp. WMMC415]
MESRRRRLIWLFVLATVPPMVVLPTVSAIEAPPGEYARVPVYLAPAFHGGLLGRPAVHDRAVDFLAGDRSTSPGANTTSCSGSAPPGRLPRS